MACTFGVLCWRVNLTLLCNTNSSLLLEVRQLNTLDSVLGLDWKEWPCRFLIWLQGGQTEEEIEADKMARLARHKSMSREHFFDRLL